MPHEKEMTIDLTDSTGEVSLSDLQGLRQQIAAVLLHLGLAGTLRVRVVADVEMAAAHEEFTGVPGTTDVLTFDMNEMEDARLTLDADVLICVDEARRQANDRAHTVPEELLLYVVHGVMHCLGHTDDTEEGYQAMHAAEDAALGATGVGALFGERGGFRPH